MNRVDQWLESLGFGQYADVFADNAIHWDLLPELTEQDLRELGVAALGHRKQLLKAIAALSAEDSVAASTKPRLPAKRPEAERRQLTVMFCDLVGSTALSKRFDPEDLSRIIRTYQDCCAGIITGYEGYVARYMGDGILAYFGYPRAHEDDAERSLRAGLELVEAVSRLELHPKLALQVRIGVATGLVVVGETIGTESAQEQAVVGETPNLAARLQSLAQPNSLVIAAGTRQLVGDLFAYADLGNHPLKGFAEPVQAWRVMNERVVESRFAARARMLTPLIGREAESRLLLDRWEQAKGGEGQVVLLSGEPGIGKSRLIQGLREQLAEQPHHCLHYQCSPHHTHSTLYPIISELQRAAGLTGEDTPEQKLTKLETLLAQSTQRMADIAPLIAALLSLPTEQRYPPLNLAPQRQKQLTLAALTDRLLGLAARQPVLFILEDAHWLDPTTQELLGLIIEREQTNPVLMVLTLRPEFIPPWRGYTHLTALTLNRLSRPQAAALIAQIAGGKALPEAVREQLVAKTDGIPLFVEELTKTVLESGWLQNRGDHYDLADPLPTLTIPATLQDALMARLDPLGPVKEVAQLGAVIGREFSHALLAAVSPLRADELQQALARLVDAELVSRRGAAPEASYTFKHALIQDAAYQSLLNRKRQQLHGRIAAVLEERFADRVSAEPELVAHHYSTAGETERAVGYWLKAGQRAIERSANLEAIEHLNGGLSLLWALPRNPERGQRELELRLALGPALTVTRGQAAPEVGATYSRARRLCRQLKVAALLPTAMFGEWMFHNIRANLTVAHRLAKEVLRLSRQDGTTAQLMSGHQCLGITLFWLGDQPEARRHLEQALTLTEPAQRPTFTRQYPFSPRVTIGAHLGWILHILGYPAQALQMMDEALAKAQLLSHPGSEAAALSFACLLHQLRREWRPARDRADALVALTAERAFSYLLAWGRVVQGWALAAQGQTRAGIAELRQGIEAYADTGAKALIPYFWTLLIELHAKFGQDTEAVRLLDDAFQHVAQTGERWIEPELQRWQGELLFRSPDSAPARAEVHFRKAITLAREQGARMWELRAATSLARLWRDQGKREEARDLLAPIYDWFTEGFDTADLKDAKALLDELM